MSTQTLPVENKQQAALRVEAYNPEHEEVWDDFIWNSSRNGTLLHTRSFYNHNAQNIVQDASLLFFANGKLVAVLPAILERNILNSHKNATYGGFVIATNATFKLIEGCIRMLLEYAKSKNVKEIIVRQSLRVYHRHLSDEIEYALWRNGFRSKYKECELTIDLKGDFRSFYRNNTKRNIAKAHSSGTLIRECDDFSSFWKILTTNLEKKYHTQPVHSLEQIQKLLACVGSKNIKLFGSYLETQMIGGILVFVSNSQVVHSQYIASDVDYKTYRPVSALIDHIAAWSKDQGFAYLSLGMANHPGGAEINEGLFRFKEGFGAKGTLRDTLYYTVN